MQEGLERTCLGHTAHVSLRNTGKFYALAKCRLGGRRRDRYAAT